MCLRITVNGKPIYISKTMYKVICFTQFHLAFVMISKTKIGRYTSEFQQTNSTGEGFVGSPLFIVYKHGSFECQFTYMRFPLISR